MDQLQVTVKDVTKSEITAIAESIFQQVDEGEISALDVIIKAKALEDVSKQLVDKVKKMAIEEAEAYDKGERKRFGVVFELSDGVTTYSYDHNPDWVELNDKIEKLTEKRKEIESEMKTAIKYGGITKENGDFIPAALIKSAGAQQIKIKIPK